MTNPTENVIDMRSLGGNRLGESKKKDGVLSLTNARRLEDALNASHRGKRMWNTFFVLACCAAVFVDPLYCYLYVIDEIIFHKYITVDMDLKVAFTCLRLIVDVLYMIDIIISVLRSITRKKRKNIGKLFGACYGRTRSGDQTTVVRSASPKGYQLIKASLIRRSLVALPIVEISILLSSLYSTTDFVPNPKMSILVSTSSILAPAPAPAVETVENITILSTETRSQWPYFFYITISIQYIFRIYDIYASLRRRPILKIRQEKWLKPILDFLPFILASHLFGALWYFFAIQRQLHCWRLHYKDLNNLVPYYSKTKGSIVPVSLSEKYCPVREENSTIFNFGIYLSALQSNYHEGGTHFLQSNYHEGGTHFLRRLSLSFWWALRNLSSFGSNLYTSSLPSEIYFSVLISISGMMLFLVYLNARVQETREMFKELNAKKKKQLMIPDVDLWLSKNDLPKDLKTVIMDNIHKLENNEVINVQSILSVLPIDDKTRIVYHLCMASLRKVPVLETMNENVLKGIVEHLKPVIYNEDNYIVQEGKPLGKMLFITQGIAWTYTANGSVGTICDSKWLERGSFCGEELLNGAFKSPFLPDIAISTRTVISQEQVEAFAIRARDLKSVVVKFWWYFSMKVTSVSQLKQWEYLAACSIQATWRHYRCAKARGLRANSGLMCCCKNCF